MLRDILINEQKAVPTYFKANAAMKTGMGVVLNVSTGVCAFPTAEAADNIYVVDKERYATGANAARTNFSDYEDEFHAVAKDDVVKLRHYDAGEEFATDAFTGTIAKGDAVAVGTDGKWKKAATTVESRYICVDPAHDDAGHILLRVRVLDAAIKNS